MSDRQKDVEVGRPARLQLSRRKGFDLQVLSLATNGLPAVNVARPSMWGNPISIDHPAASLRAWATGHDSADRRNLAAAAVALYRAAIAHKRAREAIRRELGGHNLACWCKPGEPCHADVLLELANQDDPHV